MKYKVLIEKINWISNPENEEADISVRLPSGKTLEAFCHPCNLVEGNYYDVCFDFIEGNESEESFWRENRNEMKEMVQSKRVCTKYYCYGVIESINPIIIDCEHIKFEFGNFSNDYRIIGSYVYFSIERLDIILTATDSADNKI